MYIFTKMFHWVAIFVLTWISLSRSYVYYLEHIWGHTMTKEERKELIKKYKKEKKWLI